MTINCHTVTGSAINVASSPKRSSVFKYRIRGGWLAMDTSSSFIHPVPLWEQPLQQMELLAIPFQQTPHQYLPEPLSVWQYYPAVGQFLINYVSSCCLSGVITNKEEIVGYSRGHMYHFIAQTHIDCVWTVLVAVWLMPLKLLTLYQLFKQVLKSLDWKLFYKTRT